MAQSVFPSCICAAVLPVLHLLDDHDVNADGVSGLIIRSSFTDTFTFFTQDENYLFFFFLKYVIINDRVIETFLFHQAFLLFYTHASKSMLVYMMSYVCYTCLCLIMCVNVCLVLHLVC